MIWFRIDNRLVHGQIIEAWLPYLNARELAVVNNSLAADPLRQEITRLAIPERVHVSFVPMPAAKALYDELLAQGRASLFVVENCNDVMRLVEEGVPVPLLNVGNMHFSPGKKQICSHVAASEEDMACLENLRRQGTVMDFRCVPSDTPRVEDW